MVRILLLLLVPFGFYSYWKYISKAPPELRKQRLKHLAFGAAALVLAIVAVRSGSVQAMLAAIGVGLVRALPFLVQRFVSSKVGGTPPPFAGSGEAPPPRTSGMSRQEALEILDLKEGATSEEINKRYKELMRNMHPDRGGSSHLAAQINRARDTLLKGS